jgi:histidine triad (HIT) family protein
MFNHQPSDYNCPFCRMLQKYQEAPLFEPSDFIYKTERVTAFLGLGRWTKNPMDVLIVTNSHIENLYDLPADYAIPLHQMSRAIAIALKAICACDGTTLRQHNEPAGDQDVWHYHAHITPRYRDDHFYQSNRVPFPEDERFQAAASLRTYLQTHQIELLAGYNT